MTEHTDAAPETFDPVSGKANADPNDFLAEGEGEGEGQAATTEGEETSPVQDGKPDEPLKVKKEEGQDTNPQGETTTTPSTPQQPQQDTLLAGKFKTEDDLKKAYQELGGDPSRYSDQKMLEEAYLVRQREFTQSRQFLASQGQRKAEQPRGTQPVLDEQRVEDAIGKIDWSKVNNAQDAVREAVRVSAQTLPRQEQPSPEQIAEQIAPIIEDREKKLTELSSLENNVPRLKSDSKFRTAFAGHVNMQKMQGHFINLQESMKDFLDVAQGAVEELNRSNQQNKTAKANAQQPTETDQTNNTEQPKDEVDEILGAYGKSKERYSI